MERLLVVAVVLLLVSLPIYFFMFGAGGRFLSGADADSETSKRSSPGTNRPDFNPRVGDPPVIEVRKLERQDLETALAELERIVQDFDLEVRRIESRRLSGALERSSGSQQVLIEILSAPKARFIDGLRERGRPIGFGAEVSALVYERTPVLTAFETAERLPDAIERVWRSGEGLEELPARDDLRRILATAKAWVQEQ